VALPGEKLSRAQTADAASVPIEEPIEVLVEDLGEGSEVEGADGAQPTEAGRRRRRRGGRGRGHGGGAREETAPGEDAAEAGDETEQEGPATPPANRPNQFGSVWDSQIGMVGRPERLTPITPADEDDFAEPEIPEYLLAERQRGGRGQSQGRSGGGRGVRSAYASAVERERYGRSSTRYPEPVRQAQTQPPRRRDERPQRQPQPQQHRGGGGVVRSSGRDSAEPWSEVPPELEEILRAQLSTKLSRQAEAPIAAPIEVPTDVHAEGGAAEGGQTPKAGARRGGRRKVEAVTTAGSETPAQVSSAAGAAAEAPAAIAEAPAKPASRSRRKPAATEATVESAPTVDASVKAAPKRRAPARKKPAEGEAPTESTGEPTGE
jgi:hypothetical protein